MKATPWAHLARAGLEEGEPVAGREPGTWWRQIGPVFTAQPRCCNRKRAGGEEAAQAETIYLEHEEQLGRSPALPLSKAK